MVQKGYLETGAGGMAAPAPYLRRQGGQAARMRLRPVAWEKTGKAGSRGIRERSGLVLVVVFVEDMPAEADEIEQPRLFLRFGSVEGAHAAAAVGKREQDGLTLDGIGTALRARTIKIRVRNEHLIEDSVIEESAVGHELHVLP